MSRDYLELGTAPVDEDCAQYGKLDYYDKVKPECRRFIELLRNIFGEEPDGARLSIKSSPYDGDGNYYDVVCYFDPDKPASMEYAFNIENNLPMTWNDKKVS